MSNTAKEFLAQAARFRLGTLPTEMRHPQTMELAHLAEHDLASALRILKTIEFNALSCVLTESEQIKRLAETIGETLRSGGRIFFCGCGATGRLSLALETLWREQADSTLREKVFSFMAGGDYALIRSIEKFEDHFEYGARQLRDAGFITGDLLIASTEGGETPFVIGAAEEALLISSRQPTFLYCNPPELLMQTVERSRRVLENPRIHCVSLNTGPMALSGSTRLQASSALMLAAGAALFSYREPMNCVRLIETYISDFAAVDFTELTPLIIEEASIYAAGELCVHRTDRFGITVATDTTERTPTFSLLPFESGGSLTDLPSWTYLCIKGAAHSTDAWHKMLHRSPRALAWPSLEGRYGLDTVLSFDFGPDAFFRRSSLKPTHVFEIENDLSLHLKSATYRIPKPSSLLGEHLILKAALNFISTLVMGRLGRFSSNLMLYVRPTNNKLIDRSIRYVQELLKDAGLKDLHSYDEICEVLFEVKSSCGVDEPVVLLTFEKLSRGAKSENGPERVRGK